MLDKILKSSLGVSCVKEYRFYPERRWRADYAIIEYKILIEEEGGVWTSGRHTRGKGFIGDMEKYNTATAMGYKIIRIVPGDYASAVKFIEQILDNNK
jgi:hypothetical protein